ncbi:hypothetical protein ACFO4E_27170 [Nocardiopsis mangrovi]|uniref:Translation elongation factor EFG/EF2 domain-containing protein n=1 Tax=Nocardiopsis mangrovi TaxID=1179818 RepID=A0ABV9E2Y8_9ACTN
MSRPDERPAELPRPIDVRVDHSEGSGADRVRVRFDIAFEPLPANVRDDFAFAARLPASDPAPPEWRARRLGSELDREWETACWAAGPKRGRPVRTRAVLRRLEWDAADPDPDADALTRVLDQAAALAAREAHRALTEGDGPRAVGRNALPRPPALPRAVPGVYVRHIMQTGCPGYFAMVWADAEPLPGDAAEDIAFTDDLPARPADGREPLPPEFTAAFGTGVRDALALRGGGRSPFAVHVVLRDALWHEVDSNEYAFRAAGRLAAKEILDCVAEGRAPRPVGRGSGRLTAVPPMPRTRTAR